MISAHLRIIPVGCALLSALIACDVVPGQAPAVQPPRLVPTLYPTFPATLLPTLLPTPTAETSATVTPERDSGWIAGDSGLELRRLLIDESPKRPAVPVTVVRLDPDRVRLRVAYAPEHPQLLRLWFATERPLLAINGGFFHDDYTSTALVISDGNVRGTSYQGFGGMFAVAPDGAVSIRALADQPYAAGEQLAQAIQSFPMLVLPGGGTALIEDDGRRARRSAVALDRAGRLLFIASPTSSFTLHGLAQWLGSSDLDIDRALNLDGGSSTGLFVDDGAAQEEIDAFAQLPMVLLVETR